MAQTPAFPHSSRPSAASSTGPQCPPTPSKVGLPRIRISTVIERPVSCVDGVYW